MTTPLVVNLAPPVVVQVRQTPLVVRVAYGPGAVGPQGPAGGNTLDLIANGSIGGHRVVIVDASVKASYASNAVPGDAYLSAGVSTNAAADGGAVSVVTSGLVTEPSWSWTPRAHLFLGVNGLLTETCPAAPAYARMIAQAVTATEIYVSPQPPIFQS